MGDLHALGARGGAGGKDDHGRVLAVQRTRIVQRIAACAHAGIEVHGAGDESIPAAVGDEHPLHGIDAALLAGVVRARGRGLGEVIAEAVRLADNRADAAAVELEGALVEDELHVDGHRHRADLRQGEGGRHVLRRVVQLDGHVVALPHTDGQKEVGRAVHQAVEFAVGERATVAGPILAGQKKMIAAACGQLVPQIAEILIAYDGRHGVRSFSRTCQWEEGPPFPSGPSLRIVDAMRSRGRHGYSAHFTMPSAANRAICSSL